MEIQFLNRTQAAKYVQDKGLPCAKTQLAKLASIGGGPIFRRWGRACVYLPPDLDIWIEERLTGPAANTADFVPPKGSAVDGRVGVDQERAAVPGDAKDLPGRGAGEAAK